MRLIDADALRKKLLEELHNRSMQGFGKGLMIANSCVVNAPTIQPDPDTVSRQAVLNALVTYREDMMHHFEVCYGAEKNRIDDCISLIKNLPPSPTQSRPKGQWIKEKTWSEGIGMGETYGFYYTCSECKKVVKGGYDNCGKNFCPNCGADMQGVRYELFSL